MLYKRRQSLGPRPGRVYSHIEHWENYYLGLVYRLFSEVNLRDSAPRTPQSPEPGFSGGDGEVRE